MSTFGARLKSLREALGWSQERVGFELGVTKATVSKWELGRAEPGLEHLARIREVYRSTGVTLDQLILGPAADEERSEREDAAFEVGYLAAIEERRATYASRAIATESTDESHLLARFRQLTPKQKQGLLDLLAGG